MKEFKGTKGEWIVGVANVKDSNKDELVISKKGGEKVDRGYRFHAGSNGDCIIQSVNIKAKLK